MAFGIDFLIPSAEKPYPLTGSSEEKRFAPFGIFLKLNPPFFFASKKCLFQMTINIRTFMS